MAESVMEHITAELRRSATGFYPGHGELKALRIVGHTPKYDHFIYEVVMDFDAASERLAAKVYRGSKCGAQGARQLARLESNNLTRVYEIFSRKKLTGVPRPIGDFADLGAVVTEKFCGPPFQSIIMKAALLPGFAGHYSLAATAAMAGKWLRTFHNCTADLPEPFDGGSVLAGLEKLCESCRSEGLDDASIRSILSGARTSLAYARKSVPSSAVLNDFTPLNVIVGESGIGVCDYARMASRSISLYDVAQFLACVEALEKYPFCNRDIIATIQQGFMEAYGVSAADQTVLRVLKMKSLLLMFAQGRNGKENAARKKVMWATVMKRFIQNAAQRSLSQAA